MNNKAAQNDLHIMVQQSLALRLRELGANDQAVDSNLEHMDFDELRSYFPRTNDELKSAFAHLF